MQPITFAMIGASGWRAEFFLRIAQALPDQFRATALMTRDAANIPTLEAKWGTPAHTDLDAVLAEVPDYAVVSVPWPASPVFLNELSRRGVPALAETPPAPDLEGLNALHALVRAGAKIQVAEQLQFRPLHAARIALANSGRLGAIAQAQVAVAHGYHGISLMRRYLNAGFASPAISAYTFTSPMVQGAGRGGPPQEEKIISPGQTIARFDYGDKLGVFDFASSQYFASIRGSRTLVRGERGEIGDRTVRLLMDFQTPVEMDLRRRDAGHEDDLRPLHHEGITLGDEWVYRNPFAPAHFSDDEIAVATCMQKMGEYVRDGPPFYSVAEASQDHYLSLLMNQAVANGQTIQAQPQVWT